MRTIERGLVGLVGRFRSKSSIEILQTHNGLPAEVHVLDSLSRSFTTVKDSLSSGEPASFGSYFSQDNLQKLLHIGELDETLTTSKTILWPAMDDWHRSFGIGRQKEYITTTVKPKDPAKQRRVQIHYQHADRTASVREFEPRQAGKKSSPGNIYSFEAKVKLRENGTTVTMRKNSGETIQLECDKSGNILGCSYKEQLFPPTSSS